MKLIQKGNPALKTDLVSPKGQKANCINCDAVLMTEGGEARGPCKDLYYTKYAHAPSFNATQPYGWVVQCSECGTNGVVIWFKD